MRLTPPPSLRLDRAALLRDVADRLAARRPDLAERAGDPTDPGWMLLEQCAWMVEQLSMQLDEYPLAALQTFGALLGVQRNPAHPALGAVVVLPSEAGTLAHPTDRPAPWRFFTAQTETRDMLEFALAELSVPVMPAEFGSWCAIERDELWVVGRPAESTGIGASRLVGVERRRATAFSSERARWQVVTTNPAELVSAFQTAIASLTERKIGWLGLKAEAVSDTEVRLEAWLDPAAAFKRAAPEGRAPGGDLEADWVSLDDSAWTPSARVSSHPGLPPALRGTAPMPGSREGTVMIPGVPVGFPVAELLQLPAQPMPETLMLNIWSTLININVNLAPLRPSVRRVFAPSATPLTPSWVSAALAGDGWGRLASRGTRQILHIRLRGSAGAALRLGLMTRSGSVNAVVWPIDPSAGLLPTPLAQREAWSLPLPTATEGRVLLTAVDVEIPSGVVELLVSVDGPLTGALLNPVLVWNAPTVSDNREVEIERAVPESVSLLHEDIVTTGVRERLLEGGLPARVSQLVRRLPLASFTVDGQDPIRDMAGLATDPSQGEIVFGAPDPAGALRELRPGVTVRLDWYRRTDGAAGEVEPGAIQHVEQPPLVRPVLLAVDNPLGTFYGAAREREEVCRERLFAPRSGLPVLPGDWEQLIRAELGPRARGWLVRCWGHAERNLLSAALWPPDSDEASDLLGDLEGAGPSALLVALGPSDALLSTADLDWARGAVLAVLSRVRQRLPALDDAFVTRLWPLTLIGDAPVNLVAPCFELRGLEGRAARGPDGVVYDLPRARLLLNAAIVADGGAR